MEVEERRSWLKRKSECRPYEKAEKGKSKKKEKRHRRKSCKAEMQINHKHHACMHRYHKYAHRSINISIIITRENKSPFSCLYPRRRCGAFIGRFALSPGLVLRISPASSAFTTALRHLFHLPRCASYLYHFASAQNVAWRATISGHGDRKEAHSGRWWWVTKRGDEGDKGKKTATQGMTYGITFLLPRYIGAHTHHRLCLAALRLVKAATSALRAHARDALSASMVVGGWAERTRTPPPARHRTPTPCHLPIMK